MTDELTPEEREALKSLPRERTPSAGLEDRVVAAMRQHGVLARKPARVIRITSTRVAGLLAACLVLMVGAYSIGLHRGVDNNVLKNIEPSGSNVSGFSGREEDTGLKPPASEESVARKDAPASVPESAVRDEGTLKSDAPPLEWKLKTTQLVVPRDAKKEQAAAKENEVRESVDDALAPSSSSAMTPPAPAARTAAPMQLESKAATEGLTKRSRTFALNGGTLIVDAPDSVRVVQDAQGRTLLIYTSDGIIRIRLAD
jgi:hypothetical protein